MSVNSEGGFTLPSEPKKEGYYFAGWFAGDTERLGGADETYAGEVSDFLKIYPKYVYSFVYVHDADGNVLDSIEVNPENPYIGLPSAPAAEDGYKFIGWYGKATSWCSYSCSDDDPDLGEEESSFYYAFWERGIYSIYPKYREILFFAVLIYDENGNLIDSAKVDSDSAFFTLPSLSQKEGYLLAGWYDGDGNKVGDPDKRIYLKSGLKIYPKYILLWAGTEPDSTTIIDGKNYYVITNDEELTWFSTQINSGNTAINGILANDIVWTDSQWIPMGTDTTNAFAGVFDGNGFGISEISIGGEWDFCGFVGYLATDGVVKNLTMKSGSITCGNHIGSFAGESKGTIENCVNEISIRYTQKSGETWGGGIAGVNKGKIIDCENKGDFEANSSKQVMIGGITGVNVGTIGKSSNRGEITANTRRSLLFIGGIAGINHAKVLNSFNLGGVSDGYYVGALTGLSDDAEGETVLFESSYAKSKSSNEECPYVYVLNATRKEERCASASLIQSDEFAWILNTWNGKRTHSGIWSRVGELPSFADETAMPIYRILLRDTLNYLVQTVYSNAKGMVTFPANPTFEGLVFVGWEDSLHTMVNESTISLKDQTLHAVYVDSGEVANIHFSIRFFNADSSLLDSQSVQYGRTPAYSGVPALPKTAEFTYAFVGWHVEPTAATEDFDYYAAYTKTTNSYTVTFMDGSEVFATQRVAYGASAAAPDPSPARDGYKFIGWTPSFARIVGDLTVSALFEELILRSVFIYGDSGEILDTAKVEENEKFVLPEAPEKKGYEFVGWYDDGDKFLGNPGDTITVTDDLKILAKYEEIKLSSSSSGMQSSSSAVRSSSSAAQSSSSSAQSSSSAKVSSSSTVQSSSSGVIASSSSAEPSSSSSEGSEALRFAARPRFGLQVQNRTIWVQNARVGKNFAVLDMQGRVLRRGIANSSELSFDVQNAGTYIVRVGTESLRVRIK